MKTEEKLKEEIMRRISLLFPMSKEPIAIMSGIELGIEAGIEEGKQGALKEVEKIIDEFQKGVLETLTMIGCDKKDKGWINNRIEELKSKLKEKEK